MIKAREMASNKADDDDTGTLSEHITESLPETTSNIPPGTKVLVIVNPSSGKKAGFTTNAQGRMT